MDIKKYIIKRAQEVKIDLIGFVKAEEFHELKAILKDRESKNHLSGFEEKDIKKRVNPKLLMENAKTIIVIGISYNNPMGKNINGKVSKSSLGIDYHIVLKDKMKKLINLIKEKYCFNYKCFVDTGPLVDRYLAYKSGIGWYGKNNCIISNIYGSWIFIGYIICDLKIEPDEPNEKKCIECNKCLDACPTGALMNHYQYDAKKCISYLTQTKGYIDYDLREKMTKYIYGCDICQDVCPHNEGLDGLEDIDFKFEEFSFELEPLEILDMSKSDFNKKFGKLAMAWRGLNILKRNSLIIIGNSNDPKYIDKIKKYLTHDSKMIRKYCAWAIIKLDSSYGRKILESHLKKEKDNDVIQEINKLISCYC